MTDTFNVIEEPAYWPAYYGRLRVRVAAPQYYHGKDVVKEEYSRQVWNSKETDLSDYFWPHIKKLLDMGRFKGDIITPMPSSTPDHTSPTLTSLTEKIAQHLRIQQKTLLKRIKESGTKECKKHKERFERINGSLEAINCEEVKDKIVIILDDTRTTGMNILEATKVLLAKGAKETIGICLGINESKEFYSKSKKR